MTDAARRVRVAPQEVLGGPGEVLTGGLVPSRERLVSLRHPMGFSDVEVRRQARRLVGSDGWAAVEGLRPRALVAAVFGVVSASPGVDGDRRCVDLAERLRAAVAEAQSELAAGGGDLAGAVDRRVAVEEAAAGRAVPGVYGPGQVGEAVGEAIRGLIGAHVGAVEERLRALLAGCGRESGAAAGCDCHARLTAAAELAQSSPELRSRWRGGDLEVEFVTSVGNTLAPAPAVAGRCPHGVPRTADWACAVCSGEGRAWA